MKAFDREGKRLCEFQAELFEKSVTSLEMSSEIFVRRYMNSRIARELDSGSFLEGNMGVADIYEDIDRQYGPSSYGSKKYHRDVMFWAGYLYRELCYCYEVSSKQAYKLLPFKDVASSYEPYHALDVSQAIERLLEAKGISFSEEEVNQRGVAILKTIRKMRI